MSAFALYMLTAVALILVIEGIIYALFPEASRKLMAMAIMMPVGRLRIFGLGMAAAGILFVWFLQRFAGA